MEPEEFEELVARAGGTCTRKPTGYVVNLKPREQLYPRAHEWIGIDNLSRPEPEVFWRVSSALLQPENVLREILAALRREARRRIIAAHALV
jgi:hypothetical protein